MTLAEQKKKKGGSQFMCTERREVHLNRGGWLERGPGLSEQYGVRATAGGREGAGRTSSGETVDWKETKRGPGPGSRYFY